MQPLLNDLIKKYDVPVPRYTSYPTVPHWDVEKFSTDEWIAAVKRCYTETNDTKGISLYLHLPFCESLCTYCACNTRITKNHLVEEPYREALLKEWGLYKSIFGGTPQLRELHLGGGTPTFFSASNLTKLLSPILESAALHSDFEFSFEGHPNNTTTEHLQTLFNLGFRRVSYGVQDLDAKVQQAIHRIQPFENLERVTKESRQIGYTSVSFDLIYGLPYQTIESVLNTVKKIITLKPDRIAFYSYAHVPWVKPGQRGYEDADLPTDVLKRSLYETGRALFLAAGYVDIGMDHFALPTDSLAVAQQEGRLHRNFMGYTTTQTDLLIGLGTSAISDAHYAYAQNLKKVEDYQLQINNGKLAVFKGHLQTNEDRLLRRCILDIACNGFLENALLQQVQNDRIQKQLSGFLEEELVHITDKGLFVTSSGRIFIRNICSVFDLRLQAQKQDIGSVFSRAI
jgi:oxygen-independent coproporphyrinogen III oxidase